MKKLFLVAFVLFVGMQIFSQSIKTTISVFDGVIIAGYVDNGSFVNFCGPNISIGNKTQKILFGMSPSLRFKEDHASVKNSFVTPTLGFGLTYCYKHFTAQIPFYYNPKTATVNGKWNMGIGVGWRLKY